LVETHLQVAAFDPNWVAVLNRCCAGSFVKSTLVNRASSVGSSIGEEYIEGIAVVLLLVLDVGKFDFLGNIIFQLLLEGCFAMAVGCNALAGLDNTIEMDCDIIVDLVAADKTEVLCESISGWFVLQLEPGWLRARLSIWTCSEGWTRSKALLAIF